MKFKHAHLGEADEAFARGEGEILFGRRAFLRGDRNAVNAFRNTHADVLLEEARFAAALWTAHDAERPPGDVREQMLGDRILIFGESEFGQAAFFVKDLVGMADGDTGDHGAIATRFGRSGFLDFRIFDFRSFDFGRGCGRCSVFCRFQRRLFPQG